MPTHRTMMIKDEEGNEEEMRLNLDLLQERKATAIREARYKIKIEHYYNKRVWPVSFRVGEYVYRKNEASRVENLGKLGPKWVGPYLVVEAYQNGSYKLRTMDDIDVPCVPHSDFLPFGIYSLFNKNKDKSENMKPSDHSLKYPPGFTPNGDNNEFCMHEENVRSVNEFNSLNRNVEEDLNGQEDSGYGHNDNMKNSKSVSGHFKRELHKLDVDLTKGIGSDDIVIKDWRFLYTRQGGSTR
ncbi:hypothetical protein Tco_0997014 [Tanacetum coccineum]